MRYIISACILFGYCSGLFSQYHLPVIWKTRDGIVDTGKLARLPIQLHDDDQLVFYHIHPDSIEVNQNQIEWVVYQSDTLLLRRQHNGSSRLMRLLYQGEVRLYRIIQPWANRQYYLVCDNQWQLLAKINPRQSGYLILRQNCQSFQPAKRIRNDYKAVELVRQINNCLNAAAHYPLQTFDSHKQQFGVLYNFTAGRGSRFDDRHTFRHKRGQPVFFPSISLQYQHQIFKNRPNIKAQLGMTIFHRNDETRSTVRSFSGGIWFQAPVTETWKFTLLHYYPGLIFYTGYRRECQLSLGAGSIFSLPLIAQRDVVFANGRGVPGLPFEQYLKKIINPKIGYYFQAGIHLRIQPTVHLDIITRLESLRTQWNRNYDRTATRIIYSEDFSRTSLHNKTIQRLQARLMFTF